MTISSQTRRAGPFTGTGSTSEFPFSFKVFAAGDILVVEANEGGVETTLVLNSDYTVTLNPHQNSQPGGTVTLAAPLADGHTMIITSDIALIQQVDLTNQGGFYPAVINDALDRLTITQQQLQESVDRAAKLPITSPTDADELVYNIMLLADEMPTLESVANNIGSVNTVGDNITDVNTVAGSIANVNAVGTSIADVNTVAGSVANVNAVAADIADVSTVAGVIGSIVTVAANIDDVVTVADDIANVNAVADNETNINTVATNIAPVAAVGTDIANVNTVATNIADVNAVVANETNINTVAADIAAVAAVGTDIANVNTVAENIVDVQNVVDNMADVTNFAGVYYGPSATDPATRRDGTALVDGDLYFNTTDGDLRNYNGSGWQTASRNTGNYLVERFSGDNSETEFTLAEAPPDENSTQVYISGVYQSKSSYSLAGDVITFSEAPPTGSDNIEVVTITSLAMGRTTAPQVSFTDEDGDATSVAAVLQQVGGQVYSRRYLTGASRAVASGMPGSMQVGDSVNVMQYAVGAPVCPATWELVADDAELPSGAVEGEVSVASTGMLYVANPAGGYFRYSITGDANVLAFGATGVGADDTAAISAALSTGRDVIMPKGDFGVSETMVLRTLVGGLKAKIVGAGSGLTTISILDAFGSTDKKPVFALSSGYLDPGFASYNFDRFHLSGVTFRWVAGEALAGYMLPTDTGPAAIDVTWSKDDIVLDDVYFHHLPHGVTKRDSTAADVVHWGFRTKGGGAFRCYRAYHVYPSLGSFEQPDIQRTVRGIGIESSNATSSTVWMRGVRAEVNRTQATPADACHVILDSVRAYVEGYFEGGTRHIAINGGGNSITTLGPSQFSRVNRDGTVGSLGVPILLNWSSSSGTLNCLGVDGARSENHQAFIEFASEGAQTGSINFVGYLGNTANIFKNFSGGVSERPPNTVAYFNNDPTRGYFSPMGVVATADVPLWTSHPSGGYTQRYTKRYAGAAVGTHDMLQFSGRGVGRLTVALLDPSANADTTNQMHQVFEFKTRNDGTIDIGATPVNVTDGNSPIVAAAANTFTYQIRGSTFDTIIAHLEFTSVSTPGSTVTWL